MLLTLGQAAKHLSVSKPTISKAISTGKLSAQRREDGSFAIDPAELERYRSANEHRFTGNRKETVAPLRPETHPETALRAELDMVRAQLAMMRELTVAETRRAEAAEAQRDAWQRQAEQVRLITDQSDKRRGWFGWLKAA